MNLTLFINSDCNTCKRVKNNLELLIKKKPGINLLISNISDLRSSNISIVPALFIDDKLYAYGEMDLDKLNIILNDRLNSYGVI